MPKKGIKCAKNRNKHVNKGKTARKSSNLRETVPLRWYPSHAGGEKFAVDKTFSGQIYKRFHFNQAITMVWQVRALSLLAPLLYDAKQTYVIFD